MTSHPPGYVRVRRLPPKPGDRRASAALLLPPAEDRRRLSAGARNPARPRTHALRVARQFRLPRDRV